MVGRTLGHYEILEPLGAGGMGEVYRARDTKLDRDVAIKVLPEDFAADADRLARFEREAKLLASLNHANIAAIYGLEDEGDQRFIAMELVEGETLADRIARSGRIEIDEALEIARQIAEALEAAHGNGVIHRDLKPANVVVTPDGKAKVLDFGLAKSYEADGAASDTSPDLSHSPTMMEATRAGMIMGTAAYMSPEQAKSKLLDKRTDIWSFGVLLHEMLAGRAAFQADDVSETLAAVLRADIELDELPTGTPAAVQQVIAVCLQRDLRLRVRDMGDVGLILSGAFVAPGSGQAAETVRQGWSRPLLVGVATFAITAAAMWGWFSSRRVEQPSSVALRASITGFEVKARRNTGHRLTISSDGSLIAVANTMDGASSLFVRRAAQTGFRKLLETEDAMVPTFSPDGAWLAFQRTAQQTRRSEVARISVDGGPAYLVAEDARSPHWGRDGRIVFNGVDGLYIATPEGDKQRFLEGSFANPWPHLLPDGSGVLFQQEEKGVRRIKLYDFEADAVSDLEISGNNPQYVSSGHLLYSDWGEQALKAVAFDLGEHRVVGPPSTVLLDVLVYDGGATQFSVSDAGTAIFGLAGPTGVRSSELMIAGADGNRTPLPLGEDYYEIPRFSPDGESVSYLTSDNPGDSQIRIFDRDRRANPRLNDETDAWFLTWSPDGRQVYFTGLNDDSLGRDLFRQASDGSGPAEHVLTREGAQYPLSVFGTRVLFQEETQNGWDLLIMTEEPDGVAVSSYLSATYNELMGTISPTGDQVAYVSDESNVMEVYVRSFPDGTQQAPVSSDGGTEPRWAPDGRAIYFRSGGELMRAPVADGAIGEAAPVMEAGWRTVNFSGVPVAANWDVHPDGELFVFVAESRSSDEFDYYPLPIEVAVGWFEELKRLAPPEGGR